MFDCTFIEFEYTNFGEASLKKTGKFGTNSQRGGGNKNQTKIPNFNLGSVITQGEGLNFSKMSELKVALGYHPKKPKINSLFLSFPIKNMRFLTSAQEELLLF